MKAQFLRSRLRPFAAFTLIESVVSLGVFSMLCVGVLGAVLQQRRIAETNVYESTALVMAQGYVEQIRSLPYNEVSVASTSPAAPLRLFSVNAGSPPLTG